MTIVFTWRVAFKNFLFERIFLPLLWVQYCLLYEHIRITWLKASRQITNRPFILRHKSSTSSLQMPLMRYQLQWSVSEELGQPHNLVIYGTFPDSRLIQSLPGYMLFIQVRAGHIKEWGHRHLDLCTIYNFILAQYIQTHFLRALTAFTCLSTEIHQ